jgi:15-cis-phytoene synthase
MPVPSRESAFASPADCAGCRGAIRHGSRSFFLASRLLPVSVREPAYAVYAFCRMADDLIDRQAGGQGAIDEMRAMIARIYAGRPGALPVERAFADVVHAYAIPRAVPEALVEGLAWDARGWQPETIDDLFAYAMRVAGTVGVMMTLLMGRREPEVLARACDLGVAMQLSNICRDIGEDAREGRLYLPASLMQEAGLSPSHFLAHPHMGAELAAVIARLHGEAERLYERSVAGIASLPTDCRAGIEAARLLYREIGRMVAAGHDPVAARAVVPARRKVELLARAHLPRSWDLDQLDAAPLKAAQFLLSAVARAPRPAARQATPAWWQLGARAARLIEMLQAFEKPPARPAGSSLERHPVRP